MKLSKLTLATSALLVSSTSLFGVIELDVVAIIPPTVGSEPTSTSVAPVVGQVAAFELSLFDTDTLLSETGYLTIELTGFGSGLTDHWISTGQGGNSDRVGIALFGSETDRTASYEFSFFEDAAYTTPLSLGSFSMQVSDIDEVEAVTVSDFDFNSINLNAPTELAVTNPTPSTSSVTNVVGENLPKNDPVAAANFVSFSSLTSFTVELEGGSPSGREFQFDFTPDIDIVPEPSTSALLFGLVALSGLALKRRGKN